MNDWVKKAAPFAVFLLAYLGYAGVMLGRGEPSSLLAQVAPVVLLGIMVGAILWHTRQQDEVRRAMVRRAYVFGFWITFLVLYPVTTIDGFGEALQQVLPLWAVPLVAWLIGYLGTMVQYR